MNGRDVMEMQVEEYIREQEEYWRQVEEIEACINGWETARIDNIETQTDGDEMQDAENKDDN